MRRAVHSTFALLTVCLLLPSSVLGGGTNNFEFLRVGVAPRPVSMGGAFAALSGGAGAIMWNPAGLSQIEDSQALAAYMNYPQDVQAGLVALGRSLPTGWSLGLGVKYVSFGDMRRTTFSDPVGQHTDSFSASDVAIAFGAAYPVTPEVRVGTGVTYISGSIESYTASAVAGDLGLLIDLPVQSLYLAACVRNLKISGSSYLREDISLPTEGRIGIGFTTLSGAARAGMDLVVGGGDGVRVASGGEMLLANSLWLRAGLDSQRWEMGQEASGWGTLSAFAWGLGMRWEEWSVDYAISPFGGLGTVHRVSLKSEL